MEARLNLFVFLSLVAAAALIQGSSAQTTHVVGDEMGWLVPPGGEVAYRTWAAAQTFSVGDVLVFNFVASAHNVAEVSKEAFDSCNTTNTISISTTSPTNITLASAGEHHFLCTFPQHCGLGQKLAINVTAAAPGPQPATPPPAPGTEVYTVGDSLGWLVPPGGDIAYETWASNKTFVVGDVLVFNFMNTAHNVLQVTKAEFDACNVSTTTTPPITASPARITLASRGEHYYMCTFPQHCSLGQKLAINVTGGDATAPAPAPSSPAPRPSSPAAPSPSSAAPPPTAGGPSTPAAPSPLTPPPPSSAGGPSTPVTPGQLAPPPPPSGSAAPVAAAALPFSFLAVALAFLFN